MLTDTTERSPTFSLAPFENQDDAFSSPSLCYLSLPAANQSQDAWLHLFGRAPRPLEWEGIAPIAGGKRLLGFDISRQALENRKTYLPNGQHDIFSVTRRSDRLVFDLQDAHHELSVQGLSLLEEHVLLKIALNMHSTLVMGRMERYEGNVMTWVRPSNLKLIDRSVRYVQHLLSEAGVQEFSYDEIVFQVLEEFEKLGPNEPVVLKTVEALKRRM